MNFYKYIDKVGSGGAIAVKVEWLNPDETVNFEFTNELYDMSVSLDVNYVQTGSRRSCTLKLNNDHNKFPIDVNSIWIGQKFKLWMGIYIDEKTPYYLPQGVFYVSNPEESYSPDNRIITINGVDKWAYLDGSLFGRLSGTYQTNIGNNIYDAIRALLRISMFRSDFGETTKLDEMIDPIEPFLSPEFENKTVDRYIFDEETGSFVYDTDTGEYISEEVSILSCPYTVVTDRGRTYGDILSEYANILCADIFYDVNGRLTLEPLSNSVDNIADTNKEIMWEFSINETAFMGLTQKYEFDKIHNDFIVLGNIVNGYQFKSRVQNLNILSDTSVQRIGLRTAEPKEDSQYYSDEQCEELAKYYAKIDTILQRSGSITSVPLFHLDVNKIVLLSTPNNNMSKEMFLVTGFNISSSSSMTLNITSVNILKDFSVIGVDI